MLSNTFSNLTDTITNQWLWFVAAGVLAVLVGILATYNFRNSERRRDESKRHNENQDQQDAWTPTGRVDFINPGSDDFILQAEDTRVVNSISGVEHREIRWRKATLDEAKRVVVAYHARLDLTVKGNFNVRSLKSYTATDAEKNPQGPRLGKDEVPERKTQVSDTERNVAAAQEYLHKLSQAKDSQDLVGLQTEQAKGLGEASAKAIGGAEKDAGQ